MVSVGSTWSCREWVFLGSSQPLNNAVLRMENRTIFFMPHGLDESVTERGLRYSTQGLVHYLLKLGITISRIAEAWNGAQSYHEAYRYNAYSPMLFNPSRFTNVRPVCLDSCANDIKKILQIQAEITRLSRRVRRKGKYVGISHVQAVSGVIHPGLRCRSLETPPRRK